MNLMFCYWKNFLTVTNVKKSYVSIYFDGFFFENNKKVNSDDVEN